MKSTVVVSPEIADCVTVKTNEVVPLLPSASDTSTMPRVGAVSSFVIVPRPAPSASVALAGAESVTLKFSLASNSVSPFTTTERVPLAWPAGIVSVPAFAT